MNTPLVELKNIKKVFPGVTALDDVSIEIFPGEVHGLIGENGAGKSTLIKVLTGVYFPEKGEIFVEGKQKVFQNPQDARSEGIACVYQELNVIQELSILDNLFLGNYKTKKSGILDKIEMRNQTTKILNLLGQDFSPDTICGKLSVGQRQMIEIGKAILTNAKLIILDEPTSSLGEQETEQLFKTIARLKEEGITFLFVSHKLNELFQMCDSVTVMRDAKHIITSQISEITKDELITYMVGRTLNTFYPKGNSRPGDIALEVKNLSREGEYYDINFHARRGEILAFSGLVGAGRTEMFQGLFGVVPPDKGEVFVDGELCSIKQPHHAINEGIALIPEDRKHQGLMLAFSVKWNLCSVILKSLTNGLFLNKRSERDISNQLIEKLRIKVSSANQLVSELSGGNQQKVVIGKWISSKAEIYVFDEPTKGIDVGAKIEVYNIMNSLVEQNKCVIMISSELPEVLGVSDRVIVMRRGRIMAEISRNEKKFNQESIMKAAWGVG